MFRALSIATVVSACEPACVQPLVELSPPDRSAGVQAA